MINSDNLKVAFDNYIKAIRSVLDMTNKSLKANGRLRLVVDKGKSALKDKINELENGSEFRQLVTVTKASFYDSGMLGGKASCIFLVKNFFRRSSYYLDTIYGKSGKDTEIFKKFINAFEDESITTYLAPMSYVSFAETIMSFDNFTIKKFSKDELQRMFLSQNKINEIFYPWAVIDIKEAISNRLLYKYWFIEVKEINKPKILRKRIINMDEVGRIKIRNIYPILQSALKRLSLFDWQIPQTPRSNGFYIPFIFKVETNLLVTPASAPDFSLLEMEEKYDPSSGESWGMDIILDSILDEHQTAIFKTFIKKNTEIISGIKEKERGWEFIEIAFNFINKAFFSGGIEQLLWHITTIETLLGQKGEKIEKTISNRLSLISGSEVVGKQFRELYDFRCNIVHGNKKMIKDYIEVEHLVMARSLARSTLDWFLKILNRLLSLGEEPSRKNLIKLIDNKIDTDYLIKVREKLPKKFPNVDACFGVT
jgi:hypothetical protein